MQLQNSRLEQLFSELCSALTERQGEQVRTRQTDSAAGQKLDQIEAEIKNWADDAQKIAVGDDDEKSVADLVERARQINQKLCEDYA
ncbi:hypothetical protein [Leisingera sp. JC1]|uniref:hypothetical protein n=1 Tax=Leisingera sp. JC1 TaxID=1855282 RepID=UPI0008036896|nr:hypothetical protein [Leisingera sp. JC1]OBY24629.1 hypothetical protein A9D60_23790 [Leisingera sp. JC1]